MAYATQEDMIARFGAVEMVQISTPAGEDMDGVATDVVRQAIADASAEADSYLRMKYATPLDVAPNEITLRICHMARYELSTGNGKVASDDVRARRKDAIEWLHDIAAGRVKLDLLEVSDADETTAEFIERGQSYPGWSR
jgi:phage gp36-like protein